MKVKALRYKKEFNHFQEFVMIEEVGGEPMVFTSATPKLQPETATIEDMRKIFEESDYYEDLDFDFDKVELVEFELIEQNTIGADIRNKLTPCLNLISLIRLYLKESDELKRGVLERYLEKEMGQSEKSIKYIADLL